MYVQHAEVSSNTVNNTILSPSDLLLQEHHCHCHCHCRCHYHCLCHAYLCLYLYQYQCVHIQQMSDIDCKHNWPIMFSHTTSFQHMQRERSFTVTQNSTLNETIRMVGIANGSWVLSIDWV